MFVVTNYLINYDYIANVLCINKDKPELKCNGKCHLNKELKKDDERKDKEIKSTFEVYFFCHTPQISSENIFSPIEINKPENLYLKKEQVGFTSSVFHPPSGINT